MSSGGVVSRGDRGQPKLSASTFRVGRRLAQIGRLEEARSAVNAGLALNPTYAVFRVRFAWTAMSDDPTYLAGAERVLECMRTAGVPEQ